MDYYYSLLESYQQLKRRTFKLSLREQEEDAARKQARQDADAAFATPIEISPEERKTKASGDELIFVKSGPDLDKVSGIGGPFSSRSMKGVNSLDELDDRTLSLVIGYFMGDSEGAAGGGTEKTEEEGNSSIEEQLELLAGEVSRKLEDLAGVDENFAPDRMEKLTALVYAPVPDVPGAGARKVKAVEALNNFLSLSTELAKNPSEAKEGKFVEKTNAFIKDNNIKIGPHGVSFQGSYFETDFMVEGDFPIATAIAEMDAAQKKDREEKGIGSSAVEIPKLSSKEQGRRDQYRGGAAEFMAEGTAPLAALLDSGDPEVRREAVKKLREIIEKAQHDTQSLDQNGKPRFELAENGEKKTLKDEKGVTQKDERGKPIYIPIMEKALDIPTLVSVFTVGVGAREGQLLVGDEGGIDDAEAISWMRERLLDSGVDEEQLDIVLKEIAENDDPQKSGIQAVILILATNREFERDYMGDLKPASTRAVGGGAEIDGQQEEMTDQGAKADMIDTFCDNPDTEEPYKKDEIAAHFDSLLSPEQKAHYATGCGEGTEEGATPFAGAKALVRESTTDDGSPCLDVDRELKVFNSKEGAKHKLGQQSDDTVDSVCVKEGGSKMTDTTTSFMNKTKDRLKNCGFPKVFKGMCDFDTQLDSKTKVYDAIFDRKKKTFNAQVASDAVKLWFDNAGGSKAKKEKRKEAGLAAINGAPYPMWITEKFKSQDNKDKKTGKPKKTEQELCDAELKNIGGYLKSGTLIRMLRDNNNSKKEEGTKGTVLKGEGLEYMIGRYAVTCGSDRECVKQKRHLSDNSQSISFNNAEIQANLAAIKKNTGRIRQHTGSGTQLYLEVKNADTGKWEVRAQGSVEVGGVTWTSSKTGGVSQTISKKTAANKPAAKKKKSTNENLMMAFLQGQHSLLEKLITQTTSNPNT